MLNVIEGLTTMPLNTDNLTRCIEILRQSLARLNEQKPDTLDYEIFRNATVKGYELTLETAGTLLKKALKPYFANPRDVDH